MKKYNLKFWYGMGAWMSGENGLTETEALAQVAASAANGFISGRDREGVTTCVPWHKVARVTIIPVEGT